MSLNLKLLSSGLNPINNIHATEHSGQPALLAIDSKGLVTILDPVLGTELAILQLNIDWSITSSVIIASQLFAGGSDGNLMVIDLRTEHTIIKERVCEGALISMAKTGGDGLVIGSDKGKVFYCKSQPFTVEKVVELGMSVLFMQHISDRQLLLIVESNVLAVINIATGDVEHTSKVGHSAVTAAVCGDGVLYFGCTYGSLYRVDLKTHLKDPKSGKVIAKKVHSSWILSMKLIRNFLITTGDDKLVVVWSPGNLEVLFTIKNHSNSVQAVEEVDGSLFTASHDGTIMFDSINTLAERLKAAEEARLVEQKQRELELEKEKAKKKKKSKGTDKAKAAKKK